MAFEINRLHLKTRDHRGTAQFRVDDFGATIAAEAAVASAPEARP